jgi:C4-dicarboxylate-specific signal transduction histidine kinase
VIEATGVRKSGKRGLAADIAGAGVAILLVVAAYCVTILLQNVVSRAGFVFFYTAVVLAAWYGGRTGGILAVVLACLTVEYFFMEPLHSLRVNRQLLPVFVEFVVSAGVVAWFSSWRKNAEMALQRGRDNLQFLVAERTAELRETNARLVAEMAERKRAEEAYYEAQAELARVTRISAMGALAASISHEVNQPLAAVVTNADACMMWLSAEQPNLEEARAAVDSIAREGTRASEIVRRIRAMFSKSAPERTALDVNAMLREATALLEPRASREQVAIDLELADALPPAPGDRVQLLQVLVNLILNGIEAMRDISDRPRRVVVRSEMREREVLVAVQDAGAGIDPKDQRRIFDAFFTTKPQGMGMGLNVSQSIVQAHDGRLWATANPGGGTTFQFTLPAATDGAS